MKSIGTKTLTTSRLILRALKKEDADALIRNRSLPTSITEACAAVARMAEEMQKPFSFHWVITLEGVVIGRIKAWDVHPYNGYLQLGYDIGPEHRGNGYMTEALRAVIRFLLMEAEANRVYCSVRASNMASRRVCVKAGMIHEGTMRQHYARQDGGFDDVCIYGIIRTDLRRGEYHVS